LGLFCLHLGWAQQKTITGTVNDDDGFPLPGATVVVEGSNRGVATDFDGNFSIETQEGETLLITYIGYSDYQLIVGSQDSYTISLSPDNELEEVVVTSLGIRREAKALGYSVQKVSSDEISRSGSNNTLDALVGKAAGVQITRSSGSAGGGSRILIRGVTSFVGDNQPLIVIDGVRTNNETLNSGANTAGTAQSNRLQDLNNDDIESINILKGSAATALYGTSGGCCLVKKTTMGLPLGLPWAISITHKGRPNLLFPMVFHCT
jgi:outer membrane receptor protein involved in Fe transport